MFLFLLHSFPLQLLLPIFFPFFFLLVFFFLLLHPSCFLMYLSCHPIPIPITIPPPSPLCSSPFNFSPPTFLYPLIPITSPPLVFSCTFPAPLCLHPLLYFISSSTSPVHLFLFFSSSLSSFSYCFTPLWFSHLPFLPPMTHTMPCIPCMPCTPPRLVYWYQSSFLVSET